MPAPDASLLKPLLEAALRNGLNVRDFGRRLEDLSSAAPDPERALRNLHRIVEASFSTSLLSDFAAHPVLLNVTLDLVGQSDYLADIIVRDPELLRWLTASDVLTKPRMAVDLEPEARQVMGLFERTERRLDALRRFHRREMLRIGARDILQEGDVETITAELSALADVVVRCVSDQAHADLNARLGTDLTHRLAVIALGKLGGGELNFSSDIDLLFVYDEDGDLPRPAGRIHTWHEYHVRIGESIVRSLTDFSAEGHLYRVDMRLRPDGRSGPLAMSRVGMMSYYEARGAAWERQMLLKARVIAGAVDVGTKFLNDLQPFIFPRTATHAPWGEIARMKETIERTDDVAGNIKLGAGGIRDIEFLVQGLQLLFAGHDRSLRTGHTLRALERLAVAGHISADESSALSDAYRFFRSIEHRLQLLHGRQTHQLPETDTERTILGRKLGKGNARNFLAEVKSRREFVRRHFDAFTRPALEKDGRDPGTSDAVDEALQKTDWPESLRTTAADRLRTLLAEAPSRRLIETALRHDRHRHWLLQAALFAPRVIERLSSEPLLLESLLGNADALLRRADLAWPELLHSDVSRFQAYNETRTAVRFLLGTTTVASVEKELTELAEAVLLTVIERAGVPINGIALMGAGKLGGREMGFGSDLDLILLFDERQCERTTAEGVARAISQGFSTTPPLYKVDFRLRPEGRRAPLAVEHRYLTEYLSKRADTWEFMAMTRLRLLWGDRTLSRRVTRLVRASLEMRRPATASYMIKMRDSMESHRVASGAIDLKLSAGGIVDVEFAAQSLALRHHELLGRATSAMIAHAGRRRWMAAGQARFLLNALQELRSLESCIRLGSMTAESVLPKGHEELSALAVGLGRGNAETFSREVRGLMKRTRAMFRNVIVPRRRTAQS